MNNNMNFDPITGQPTQNNTQSNIDNQPVVNQDINTQNTITDEANTVDSPNQTETISTTPQGIQIQNELQNIPTVEQDKDAFINNVQTINQEKQEEKKEGINFTFIIILFIIILVAIYFLFPILLKYI